MLTRIEVTREDITSGVRKDACSCPIALAIARYVTPEVSVYVHPMVVNFWTFPATGSAKHEPSRLPDRASDVARHFDGGGSLNPFVFDLDIPDSLLRAPTDQEASDALDRLGKTLPADLIGGMRESLGLAGWTHIDTSHD